MIARTAVELTDEELEAYRQAAKLRFLSLPISLAVSLGLELIDVIHTELAAGFVLRGDTWLPRQPVAAELMTTG